METLIQGEPDCLTFEIFVAVRGLGCRGWSFKAVIENTNQGYRSS